MNVVNTATPLEHRRSSATTNHTVLFSILLHVCIVILIGLGIDTSGNVQHITEHADLKELQITSYVMLRQSKNVVVQETKKVAQEGAMVQEQFPQEPLVQMLRSTESIQSLEKKPQTEKGSPSELQSRAEEAINDSPHYNESTNTTFIEVSKPADKANFQKSTSVTGLPNDLVISLNKDAFDTMRKEAGNTHNMLKTSPIIDTQGTINTMAIPSVVAPTTIACDDAVSKTMAFVSTFTDGNILCQQYDIQSFIDKRLDKKPKEK